jgi:glycosyltransferase involved in cell wall biosynthesis
VESRVVLQAEGAAREPYRLRVCALHRDGEAARRVRAAGIPVDVLDLPPNPRELGTLTKVWRYLRQLRPDLLHASIAETNFLALTSGRIAGVPRIIVEEVGVPRHSFRGRMAFSALYRLANRIIGVTEATCRYVVERDHAPAASVVTVYNCADPSFFPEPRAAVQRPSRKTLELLAVGRLHPIKNHLGLLDGFDVAAGRDDGLRLTVVGDGPLRSKVEARIAASRYRHRITFEGFRSDIRRRLELADAYVLPSLAEGCSISLIEAMATGLPVIGSNVEGIREVMGDALAVDWTFEPKAHSMAERLVDMAQTTVQQRLLLAETAQERAYRMFSPATYLSNLRRVYSQEGLF